jgi:hypothetical protein
MKYLKRNNKKLTEASFFVLIFTFLWLYFVVYMTPSRIAWYREMKNQLMILFRGITGVGA